MPYADPHVVRNNLTFRQAQRNLLTARALNDNLPAYQHKKDLDGSAIVAGPRVAAGLDPFDSKKVSP
jgi:hypothetical protein